jgi:hypothetical protein
MKRNLLFAAFVAVLALTSGCCTSKPVAWQYRVVQGSTTNHELERQLNAAGKEGFVIDSAVPMPLPPSQPTALPETMVILKRPER